MREQRWVIRSGTDFGRTIAELRRQRGLTQEELSGRSGLGRSALAKIEAGKTTLFVDHLLRLLRRLGATVTITFDDTTTEDPDAST
jgi:transcriptional regulator with XRE-family HTH domain